MDRLTSTEGFTMVEVCVVILGITVLTCMIQPVREFQKDGFDSFGDSYLQVQSEAILKARDREFVSEDGKAVVFNEKGNVQKAETLPFDRKRKKIIIELGGGRLVYR